MHQQQGTNGGRISRLCRVAVSSLSGNEALVVHAFFDTGELVSTTDSYKLARVICPLF